MTARRARNIIKC